LLVAVPVLAEQLLLVRGRHESGTDVRHASLSVPRRKVGKTTLADTSEIWSD